MTNKKTRRNFIRRLGATGILTALNHKAIADTYAHGEIVYQNDDTCFSVILYDPRLSTYPHHPVIIHDTVWCPPMLAGRFRYSSYNYVGPAVRQSPYRSWFVSNLHRRSSGIFEVKIKTKKAEERDIFEGTSLLLELKREFTERGCKVFVGGKTRPIRITDGETHITNAELKVIYPNGQTILIDDEVERLREYEENLKYHNLLAAELPKRLYGTQIAPFVDLLEKSPKHEKIDISTNP